MWTKFLIGFRKALNLDYKKDLNRNPNKEASPGYESSMHRVDTSLGDSAIKKDEIKRNLTRAIVFWRNFYVRFFNIKAIKIDSIDIRLLRNLVAQCSIDELEIAMAIYFYQCKFDRWFRERHIAPSIPKFVKHFNSLIIRKNSFETLLNEFKINMTFYDFLGLNPLVRIIDMKLPFGFDLPEEVKKRGLFMRDIIQINGRQFILVNEQGKKEEGLAYCHFGFRRDFITNELIVDNNKILIKPISEFTKSYLAVWWDKKLAENSKRHPKWDLLKD